MVPPVRIHGAGLVGLSAAAIAAEQGATVEVLDPNPDRRALAARFGATSLDREPDVVIEASGHAVGEALAGVTVGGTVVLVGSVFPADPVPFDAESIVRRLVTVAGIHNYTGAELAAAVAFLAGRGRAYPFGDAVGAVRGLHEIDAALEEAAQPTPPCGSDCSRGTDPAAVVGGATRSAAGFGGARRVAGPLHGRPGAGRRPRPSWRGPLRDRPSAPGGGVRPRRGCHPRYTVPGGWPPSGSGPPTPVVDTQRSASSRSRAPMASCSAHAAEHGSVPGTSPSTRSFTSVRYATTPPANHSDASAPEPTVFASRPEVRDSATATRSPRSRARSLSRSM